jgi:menaquinone-dependent protoporphyrinogen IX oxidase
MRIPGANQRAEQRGRILVVYAARHDHTRVIAEAVGARLRGHGYLVEIGDATTGGMPPPEDYDAVVLGFSLEDRRCTRLITSYVHHNRGGLAQVSAALFTVRASGSARDANPDGQLQHALRPDRWQPDVAAAFAGGSPFPRECMLGWLARNAGSMPPDLASAATATDWSAVARFADAVAVNLARAAVIAERTEPHVTTHA